MNSPFPGMDPYLELEWGDFHSRLAIYALEALNERLPADLACRSEKRVVVCDPVGEGRVIVPDVSVLERPAAGIEEGGGMMTAVAEEIVVDVTPFEVTQVSLNIIEPGSGGRVVTAIEFVSPTNKIPGDGLDKYLQKQRECVEAEVNLVEIDLCRSGDRGSIFPIAGLPPSRRSTYAALVRRAGRRTKASYFRLPLRQRLAGIPIPLRETDQDVILDMQPLVDRVYRTGRYGGPDLYGRELRPPMNGDDAAWCDAVIAST